MFYKIYTDGASRGNPGISGIGAYCTNESGEEVFSLKEKIEDTTNNVAEYKALLFALKKFLEIYKENDSVQFIMDSQLVVQQLKGFYKVKAEHLIPIYEEIQDILRKNKIKASFLFVKREHNTIADSLANQAIDGI